MRSKCSNIISGTFLTYKRNLTDTRFSASGVKAIFRKTKNDGRH
jgi:hypothetical protein